MTLPLPVIFVSDDLSASQVVAALAGAGAEVSPFRPCERIVLDTFDGRLHAAGGRLTLTREGGRQRLVLTGQGPAPASVAVEATPTTPGDLPPGPLRARLAGIVDPRALLPLVTVSSRRATAVVRDERAKAVAAVDIHDDLALGAQSGPALAWFAEVTAYEGYNAAARRTTRLLASIGLHPLHEDPFVLAAGAAGVDMTGFRSSPSVALAPSDPALEAYRRVLANLAGTLEANLPGTLHDVDSEFLHDLRIAVRRTRSVLADAKGVLPPEGRARFRAEFKWVGAITSPLRDADVYLIEWPGYVAPLDSATVAELAPLRAHIEAHRAAGLTTLAGELAGPRFRHLMTEWRAWLEGPVAEAPPRAGRSVGAVVAARVLAAQGRLLARGRSIGPDTPAAVLHELRKDAKRLRYLVECFGGLMPAARRKPFVERLKALQDNLGEHQDTEVHTAQLQAMAKELHGAPGVTATTLVAMGRLTEIFEQRRRGAREEFAGRFSAYDTKQTARALADLLDPLRRGPAQ